jgi:hypothetical protein
VNTQSPQVSGTVAVGQQLQASSGTWTGSPAPSFAYQWSRCDSVGASCAAIGGAAASSYTVVNADVGSTLRVTVTATNSSGSASAGSSASVVVPAPPPSIGPTTPLLDDFNRAAGPVGANWTVLRSGSFAPMNIASGVAVDSSSTLFAWNYWNPVSFGPDAEAYATVASYSGSDAVRIGARVTGGTAYSGYFVSIATTGVWSIIRIDGGGQPITLIGGVTDPLSSGDQIAIRIVGSVVTALHGTAVRGWSQVLSYNTSGDSVRYTAAGRLAFEFRTSTIDNFGGGGI